METAIITTIISSVCTLIGVILTVLLSNRKKRIESAVQTQFQQNQISEIQKQLKTHNDYAIKIPLIQQELEHIKDSIEEIKRRIEK